MNQDNTLLSMIRNCEEYKQQFIELQTLRKEVERLTKENISLQRKLQKEDISSLETWNDFILHVCKDGKQRTVREIYNELLKMDKKPWSNTAKTPKETCSATCGKLFCDNKLCKTNDSPVKYFILL